MKLVELLARELEEWPDPDAVAVQDKDKEVRFEVGSGTCAHDFVAHDLAEEDMTISDPEDGIPWAGRVTCEQWEAERARIETPAWNGEGLPPVGVVCEIRLSGRGVRESAQEFLESPVRVAAIFQMGSGTEMIAVDGGPERGCEVFRADMAHPVRTPEQIAAEERERVIAQLAWFLSQSRGPAGDVAKFLYDHGYRKTE